MYTYTYNRLNRFFGITACVKSISNAIVSPPPADLAPSAHERQRDAANPRAENLELRVFESVILIILRGGIPRSMWDFPEIRTLRFLACGFLVHGMAAHLCIRIVIAFAMALAATQAPGVLPHNRCI